MGKWSQRVQMLIEFYFRKKIAPTENMKNKHQKQSLFPH